MHRFSQKKVTAGLVVYGRDRNAPILFNRVGVGISRGCVISIHLIVSLLGSLEQSGKEMKKI